MVEKLFKIWMFIGFLAALSMFFVKGPIGPHFAFGVELDADANGAVDISRGGTNAQSAAGIRVNINVEDGAEANEPLVSQANAEAGTSETESSWSPLRVFQAIAAWISANTTDWDKDASDDFSGAWGDITGMPAGFADGTDDGGGVTYTFGTGLSETGGHVINTAPNPFGSSIGASEVDADVATQAELDAVSASIPSASSLAVDDLISLSGVAEGAQNLGSFTGSTIPDNQNNKQALQAIETAVEGLGGGHDAVSLAASATTGGMSLLTQEIGFQAATNAQNGYMTSTLVGNIETNNAKATNVSTALSTGTRGATTYGVTSDGGTDDLVLLEATTNYAGLLGADKWDEIVANTSARNHWDGGATDLVPATGRTSLGLVIGTDVQAYDADLLDIADRSTSNAYQFGTVTATGGVVGNVTGNCSGSSGSCTGNAATVTNGLYSTDFGTGSGDVCEGDDSRLSDARTPTSHNNTYHSETYITSSSVTYENLSANSDIGTGAAQVAQGNHAHTDTISHERGGLEADVSAYDGVLKVVSGATGYVKYNFGTSANPTVNDDVDGGWSIGSKWYDTTADKEYTCLDTTDGAAVWSEGGGGKTVYTIQKIIAFPDQVQLELDDWPLFTVESAEFSSGITIVDIGIKTPTSSSFSVTLLEYTSPSDGSPSTIETIATSSSYEAEDDGTLSDASVAAGSIIYVDLPATDVSWVLIWMTYTIN